MADRSIAVRLRAEVSDFKRQMDEAAKATKKVGDEGEKSSERASTATGRMVQSATQNREAWDQAGTALTTFGAVTTAALGATVAAAVSWESSWAGVLKTVDGTPEQLAQVEEGLRGLTKVLPASHSEIAAVAEAAGQLGVSTGEVVDFTKVMIDLGETTNLSAEEAATSLARFSNIMGTSQSDVGKLGSALVGLGNNYATTEREIVDMSMRLAGAGRQMGLNEGQVLGLAAAMSSVGIEAEAGGTAMSTVMKKIDKAVDEGGSSLQTFARVSGMSASDFQTAWEEDASGSLAAFIMGLQGVEASGESVNALLSDLGVTGIRESDALLRLSAAGTLALDAMTQGVTEYTDATALIDEANKRYETAESKIQIAKNAIMDAAIEFGGTFLPVLAEMAEGVADLATWFGNLPGPVKSFLGVLGALTGGVSLLAGGFLLTVPRLIDTYNGFKKLADTSPRLASGLGRVGATVAKGGALLVGLTLAATALNEMHHASLDAVPSVDKMTQALLRAEGVTGVQESFAGISETFDDMKGAADRILNGGINTWADENIGSLLGMTTATGKARDAWEVFGQTLETVYQSNPAEAEARLEAAMAVTGRTREELLGLMPAYADALANTDSQQMLAAGSADQLAEGLAEVDPAAAAAAEALQDWHNMIAEADAGFLDLVGGYNDATAAAQEFADGATASAEEFIAQLQAQVDAQTNWESNMLAIATRVKDGLTGEMRLAGEAMIDELLAAGPAGADAVALINSMSEEEFAKTVELYGNKGADAVAEFAAQMTEIRHPEVDLQVDASGAQATVSSFAQYVADASPTTYVWADTSNAEAGLGAFTQAVFGSNPTSYVYADTGNADKTTQSWMDIVASTLTNTKVGANDESARGTVNALQEWVSQRNPSILAGADDSGARTTVGGLTTWAGQQKATIGVTADTSQAEEKIGWATRARTMIINAVTNAGGGGAGTVQRRSGGGEVRGPGTPTSDSIPALLSDTEWVIKASSARKYGPEMMRQINDGTYNPAPSFDRFARFRDGGQVGAPAPSFRYLQPSVAAGGRSVTNVRTFNVTSDSATNAVRELSRREALMERDLVALAGEVY